MKEKRTADRRNLLRYLKIFDKESGEFLGHLVNISAGGMLMVSEQPVQPDTNLHLHIELVSERIPVKVCCVWCREDPEIESYNIGFNLFATDPETDAKLKMLIQTLKENR
ncbi:MAG: PilZ domain-containing protein [Desulfobacterales bacterium]